MTDEALRIHRQTGSSSSSFHLVPGGHHFGSWARPSGRSFFFPCPGSAPDTSMGQFNHHKHLAAFRITSVSAGLGPSSSIPRWSCGFVFRKTRHSLRDAKWRGIALDFFDGKGWSKSIKEKNRRSSWKWRLCPIPKLWALGLGSSYQVLMEPSNSGYLFALDRIQRLKVNAAPVIWDPADDSLSAPPHPFRRLAYQGESLLHDAYASQPLSVLTDDDRRRYLQLPSLDSRVAVLAKEISSGAMDERTLADKTEKFLHDNYRYSLEEAPIIESTAIGVVPIRNPERPL